MKYNFDEQIDRANTGCEKYDSRLAVFGKADVIPLWVADMDFRIADVIREALQAKLDHGVFGYGHAKADLYKAIVRWVQRRNGWDIKPSWITFCPGVVPGLGLSVQAFSKPGDKVVIQPPIYPPFFSAVTANDRVLLENRLVENDGYYTIDFDDLDKKLAEASLFILCSPHNPVGRAWTREELMKMGELCIKHKVRVVADEIHADIIMPSHKHIHFASLSPEISDITLTFIAASKSFNIAGISLGIAVTSNTEMFKEFEAVSYRVGLGDNSSLGIIGTETAYNKGEAWLEQLLTYISGNADFVIDFLKRELPMVKTRKPEATYLMWLDFRQLGMTQEELVHFLVFEAGLGLNNGITFGENGKGYMRLNLACPRATLEKALTQLKSAYNKRK